MLLLLWLLLLLLFLLLLLLSLFLSNIIYQFPNSLSLTELDICEVAGTKGTKSISCHCTNSRVASLHWLVESEETIFQPLNLYSLRRCGTGDSYNFTSASHQGSIRHRPFTVVECGSECRYGSWCDDGAPGSSPSLYNVFELTWNIFFLLTADIFF